MEDFLEIKNVVNVFRGDGNFLKARQEAKKGELDEQLRQVNTCPTKLGYFQLGLKRIFPPFRENTKLRNFRQNV
jgi:hypothetical protein